MIDVKSDAYQNKQEAESKRSALAAFISQLIHPTSS